MAVLIKLVPDDAYFYLKTANNFALGLGSTFDGVNPTNGYHPLWFLILAALFWTAHLVGLTEPDHLLRVTVFVAVALWLATAWCVAAAFRLVYPRAGLVSAVTAFALVSMLFLVEGHIGMESHLVCLLAAVYIWIKVTEIVRERHHVAGTAVVLALLVLSRIDFLFTLVPVIILFEIWTCSPSVRLKTARSLSGLVIAVSAAYFSINYLAFGHVMTVSATVRSSFPRPVLAQNLLEFYELVNVGGLLNLWQDGTFAVLRFLFPIAAYAVFCWCVFRRSPGRPHRLDLTLVACGVGATAFLLLNATFNQDSLFAWYTALPVFIASLMLLRIGLETRWIGWNTSVVLALLVCMYALRLHYTPWPSGYDVAHELRRITTVEDRIFQVDSSGMLGFFSGRRVINGDGLINSFEFNEYIQTKRLKEYLRAKSVDYWSSEMRNVNDTNPDLPALYIDDGALDLGFEFTCLADDVAGRMRFPTSEGYGEWILCRLKPDIFRVD